MLRIKPGAFPGSTVLSQARKSGIFTAVHDAFWFEARKTDGDAGGTRALIEVLLLHRSMDAEDVIAGIAVALQVGAVTADVVAVEARRAGFGRNSAGRGLDNGPSAAKRENVEHRVVSLTQRRLADPEAVIAGLPADKKAAAVRGCLRPAADPAGPQNRPKRR